MTGISRSNSDLVTMPLNRLRFQDQRLIPDVPRPLRPPSDMGLAMDLAELEKSKAVPGEEMEMELVLVDVLETR